MRRMFAKISPDNKVFYQTYREIFKRDFNISLGYPRSDTCSQCDKFTDKLKIAAGDDTEITKLQTEEDLHLHKAT